MRRILDVVDGITTWHEYDPLTKETRLYMEGDAEPDIEFAKALAKSDDYTKKGMRNCWWHYCHVPNSVLLKWKSMGVDISRPENLVEMVNRPEWSYLKTTNKVHAKY